MEAKEQKVLNEILESHSYDPTAVIAIMQDIQGIYRYLPEEMLCYVAKKLHLSEAKVYGVATFYENLPCAQVHSDFGRNPRAAGGNCPEAYHG